jgi:hypothetical protein
MAEISTRAVGVAGAGALVAVALAFVAPAEHPHKATAKPAQHTAPAHHGKPKTASVE